MSKKAERIIVKNQNKLDILNSLIDICSGCKETDCNTCDYFTAKEKLQQILINYTKLQDGVKGILKYKKELLKDVQQGDSYRNLLVFEIEQLESLLEVKE